MGYLLILLIVLFFLILFFYQSKRGSFDPINKESSITIKGLLAMIIMTNHLLPHLMPNFDGIRYLAHFSSLAVALFFFYSGYGLLHSYKTKNNYLDKFLTNRVIVKIYLPFFLVNTFFFLFKLCMKEERIVSIWKIFCFTLLESANWFVAEIVLFYLIFYIIYKKCSEKKKFQFATICYLLSIFIFLVLDLKFNIGTWWYISSLGFIIGMSFEQYSDTIIKLVKNKIVSKLIVLIFFIGYFVECNASNVLAFIHKTELTNYLITGLSFLLVPVFIGCFILLMSRFYIKNKILFFFGKISYYIYITHIVFIPIAVEIFQHLQIESQILLALIVICCTIVSSMVLGKIQEKLN